MHERDTSCSSTTKGKLPYTIPVTVTETTVEHVGTVTTDYSTESGETLTAIEYEHWMVLVKLLERLTTIIRSVLSIAGVLRKDGQHLRWPRRLGQLVRCRRFPNLHRLRRRRFRSSRTWTRRSRCWSSSRNFVFSATSRNLRTIASRWVFLKFQVVKRILG